MSVRTKTGAGTSATVVTSGVPGTSGETYTFPTPKQTVLVANSDGTYPARVKINALTASASVFDVFIPVNTTVDISFGGNITIHTLSVYLPTSGAHANVRVTGW